ncbi:hypothetical protein JCM3765_000399 [Sporobolomyces pararoseus]
MSLFGNTTSSAPTFSFGQPSTSSAAPAASTTSAPSLFGSTPAPSTNNTTGGLFGGLGSNNASSTPSTGLFGAPASSSTANAGGSSLFSGLGAANSANKPAGGFSFGSSAAPNSSTTPATTGSLFGGGGTSAAPSTGGLFGQTQPQQQTGGGLFGSTNQTTSAPSLFGTSQIQQQPQQQNQFGQSTATAQPSSGINKQTKFQDLPDQARNLVEEMDKFIRSQGQLADELKGKSLGSEITQTSRMFDQYAAEATTVTSLLENDSRLIATLRQDLEQSLSDLSKTTTLIEGFKAGANSTKAAEAKSVAGFPYEFFKRKSVEMESRLVRYKQTVDQISSVLTSPQSSLSPSSILPTLKAQHASLLSLASSVSGLELELKSLKDDYRGIWREKTGRLVDPFRLASGGGGPGVKGVETGTNAAKLSVPQCPLSIVPSSSSASVTMPSDLPPELLLTILESTTFTKRDLKSIARVCQGFLPFARAELYRSISFSPCQHCKLSHHPQSTDRTTCRNQHFSIHDKRHLHGFVKQLEIAGMWQRDIYKKEEEDNESVGIKAIEDTVSALPNLTDISFFGIVEGSYELAERLHLGKVSRRHLSLHFHVKHFADLDELRPFEFPVKSFHFNLPFLPFDPLTILDNSRQTLQSLTLPIPLPLYFEHFPNLNALNVTHHPSVRIDISHFVRTISQGKALRILALSIELNPSETERLSSLIKSGKFLPPNLRTLLLGPSTGFRHRQIFSLVRDLPQNLTGLRQIILLKNRVSLPPTRRDEEEVKRICSQRGILFREGPFDVRDLYW